MPSINFERKMIKLVLILFIVYQSIANAYVTLGNDTSCYFDTDTYQIQGLIEAEVDEIRLSNQVTYFEIRFI